MRHHDQHATRAIKVSWTNQAGGDWSNAANWSSGTVPNSNDAVTINTTALETITHGTGSDTVYSLSVGNDIFVLSGGSLDILHGASFANGFEQTGGVFQGGAVTIKSGGTLTGGAALGSTVLSISGTAALANYTLGGAAQIKNAKAINQTGGITIGDNTGVGATITNGAGATYAIAGDFGVGSGAASASIVNAGTFAKTAGNGTSVVNVSITNTGTISVLAGGDLQFNGPSSVIGGVVKGAGEISFAGSGGNTLTLGTATIGAIGLYSSATLSLAGTSSVLNGTLYDQSNGNDTLALGSGTLTINGAAVFQGANGSDYVNGSGGLVLNGATTASNTDFGGTLRLTNGGDFSVTSNITLGDGSGGTTGLTNASGGILQFTADDAINNGNSSANFISNAGQFEKTGGNGTSVIGVALTNAGSGVLNATTGSIQIADTLSNAGTITGAGQVFVTGSATLGAGTVLSVGQFGIYGSANVTLGTSLTYGGIFSDDSNGNDTLNLNGSTLTLTGTQDSIAGANGTAYVNGTGALVIGAGAILTLANANLGGSDTLSSAGTINQTGSISLGDGSGNTVTATNKAGATWTISDNLGLNAGNSNAIAFTNAGNFQKIGGGGTSTIALGFTNQSGATINANAGSIQISGGLSNAGTITGAGQLYVTGSATLASGTVLTVNQFGIYNGGNVSLTSSLSYAGIFSDSSNGNDTLNLGASTLTLTGTQDDIVGANGAAYVVGTGKLVLSSAGSLTLGSAVVGGSVGLTNNGVVNQTGSVTIGDGSGNVATITNAHGATWTDTNSAGIGHGSATASSFTNAGLFTVAAGNGQSGIGASFVNQSNGTINIASGSLGDNDLVTNSGTISGNDFAINGGGQATLATGSHVTTASFDLYGNALLNLSAAQTYAGAFNDYSNGTTTIDLNGNNLNLTGSANFIGANGSDYIGGGSGTLTASGNVTFGAVVVGASTNFTNAGTLLASNYLQIGDGSSNAATFVNAAKGIYDIVNDNGSVGHGSSLLSNFTNAGLFEKTGGGGTTLINAAFTNDGTITVTSGTLEFAAGSLTNNGVINGVETTDGNGNIFITHH